MGYQPLRSRTRTVKKLYLFPWRLKGQWKMPGVHKVVQEYKEVNNVYLDGVYYYWETIEWAN